MYSMRDIDAYWMNYCWNAWKFGITSSDLTAFSDGIARAYFAEQLNLAPPVNPSELCRWGAPGPRPRPSGLSETKAYGS